jgi:hypothetical protein
MYHNTFYANRCHGIIGDFGTSRYYDQRVKNNLLYRNVTCSGGAQQTNIRDTGAVILTNNGLETSAPGFVNETLNDFRLAVGSRMIDAGGPLTTATAAGSGTSLRVEDASYFYDGYTIPGEVGDSIQIIGQPATAVVVAINYATNTLTLDSSLTWAAGAGVALRHSGARPDLGAFEFGAPVSTAPRPPTNLRIIR